MKKFTILALTAIAFAGVADAQLRWNPEGAWATDNGATILPVGADGKSQVNKLGKLDNGNYRADIRFTKTVNFTEDEPYFVAQITTENCGWNLNDFKFEFMIQRKKSEGLNEAGDVVWGGNTDSYDPEWPSFDGDKYKVVDQWEADLYQLLGSSVVDGDGNTQFNEDVIVIDLNKVRSTKDANGEWEPGLLFSAGDVYFPNLNAFETVVEPDAKGEGGVQQRSWFGFVCIAPAASIKGTEPTFTIHYTGTVEDSSDALTVCENYANGEGGQEVRDGEEEDPDAAVEAVKADDLKIYLKNGKSAVCNGAVIEVYTVDGKKVNSGVNEVELSKGVYIVKAAKDGKVSTVKAIAR